MLSAKSVPGSIFDKIARMWHARRGEGFYDRLADNYHLIFEDYATSALINGTFIECPVEAMISIQPQANGVSLPTVQFL